MSDDKPRWPQDFGRIEFTQERDVSWDLVEPGMPPAEVVLGEWEVTAAWYGPPRVLVSEELLAEADPRYCRRDGDTLTMCQFSLRIVGHYDEHTLIAERVDA